MGNKIIFLGSPLVAANVLQKLLDASYEVSLVITQPPARREREGKTTPTPVHLMAEKYGIPVLPTGNVNLAENIAIITQLAPALCITAAFGQILSSEFLAIPKIGTLNIHPSLLPKYRGAAPVQRSIYNGDAVTGVTLAFTVLKMDAGPVLVQQEVQVDKNIKAPNLLVNLFDLGADLLLQKLPSIFASSFTTTPQDERCIVVAKKIKPEEALVSFALSAQIIHNRVRAFAGWPGVKAVFVTKQGEQEFKLITTEIVSYNQSQNILNNQVLFVENKLLIVCGDGTTLAILEIQPPNKKILSARDFWNGLSDKNLTYK